MIPLSLLALTACSTTEPRIIVKPELVRMKVPASILSLPCDPKRRGKLATTGDVVERLIYTEGALDKCRAKINAIRQWNKRT